MDIETVTTRLEKVVREHLGFDKPITLETSFYDDMGADSLDMVELTMATEEEFHIEISDDEAETLKTFGKAVLLVHGKSPR